MTYMKFLGVLTFTISRSSDCKQICDKCFQTEKPDGPVCFFDAPSGKRGRVFHFQDMVSAKDRNHLLFHIVKTICDSAADFDVTI